MPTSSLQSKLLTFRTSPREYQVYRAALEWDVADPIVIENREDLKSELRWRDRLEPFHHQVTNLITFCRRLPVTLIADDVGLGKTISAGLIASELIARGRLSRLLVVCPKLLGPQWREEFLTKFNLESEIAIGRSLIEAEPEGVGAVITTYASARLHLDKVPRDRFEMLILDEAHKLRNLYGVEKRPQVAQRFYDALQERRFRFVLMLTATPIHNRLWDLYSLVDLLTVARGHQNPFGSEGVFARKFIADARENARHLKEESKEEFRSIVYGYMSRIRRGDAKLYFPDRIVQMHKVEPTPAELHLIEVIAKPIQKLNRLAQISILQALSSSPDALSAQLMNMGRNGTVPMDLASSVRSVVSAMPPSAKLRGLATLISKLQAENPQRWRLVVFTGRIETQTTIHTYLEKAGLKVGIINGSSGARNQDTIARFKKTPPDCHVIVSTEAGSEGINLQVANVLVNFDLPWNPMIVEQRIGRVQRLASEHKNVSIFNVMLRGTFEEYIVGRLMEKLQMASHAIGDIEALLEASGMDDDNDDTSFEERVRRLVVAALAGKDVKEATRREELSIEEAKKTLESEEASINSMLGSMDGAQYVGPRAPTLPPIRRSMSDREFVLEAFSVLGSNVTPRNDGLVLVERGTDRQLIRFDEQVNLNLRSSLYSAGTPLFAQLVDRLVASGLHDVNDVDRDPIVGCQVVGRDWISTFNGTPRSLRVREVRRCFEGTAVVRVRVSVAHDSYERLVDIACAATDHFYGGGAPYVSPIPRSLENPREFGIDANRLAETAERDEGVAEFCRFYLERRSQEVAAASGDQRKQKKLSDDFTPRLEMTIVALHGKVHRDMDVDVSFELGTDAEYQSAITIRPSASTLVDKPSLARCAKSGSMAPERCLAACDASKVSVLRHLLIKSDVSNRLALPEFMKSCAVSGKRVLGDELEVSAVSGRSVLPSLLRTSAMSGKRAESEHFARCEFTGSEVLGTETAKSQISGRAFRQDEQERSSVSGICGHKSEFIVCHLTRQPIAKAEAEVCQLTGHSVGLGRLETCGVTGNRVLPSELLRCAATGKRCLKKLLVRSSVSGAPVLESESIRSVTGEFCLPTETRACAWSGTNIHPDDLKACRLTGLSVHSRFLVSNNDSRLKPLVDLLDGVKRTTDKTDVWPLAQEMVSSALRVNRCELEASTLSPGGQRLAICAEVRTMLGFRTQHVGFVFALDDQSITGRVSRGRRASAGWTEVR